MVMTSIWMEVHSGKRAKMELWRQTWSGKGAASSSSPREKESCAQQSSMNNALCFSQCIPTSEVG